jgi:hypothetical protein
MFALLRFFLALFSSRNSPMSAPQSNLNAILGGLHHHYVRVSRLRRRTANGHYFLIQIKETKPLNMLF